MRKIICAALIFTSCVIFASPGIEEKPLEEKPAFGEIWAYLMRGEEKNLSGNEPITDIGYFSLWVNAKGKLSEPVARPKIILNGKSPRIHLVITELTSSGFTHFCIDKKLPIRDQIIKDIVASAKDFDGIQIDFEMVIADDRENFIDFLKEIKKQLPPEKTFSIALPAKRGKVNDAYDYEEISKIADRMIIMAYDQHWSTSKPGPVAGFLWCKGILKYASEVIPKEKLVMGLPLYGRAWAKKKTSRSLRYHETMDIIKKRKPKLRFTPDNGFYFTYYAGSKVTVYFDNTSSLLDKIQHYRKNDVNAISFWRVGQGPKDMWDKITTFDAEKTRQINASADKNINNLQMEKIDTKTSGLSESFDTMKK